MGSNDSAARRRRIWIVGGAVAVVALIAGVAVAMRDGDDDQVATDTQPQTATVPTSTSPLVTEPASTEAPDSTTTGPPTTAID